MARRRITTSGRRCGKSLSYPIEARGLDHMEAMFESISVALDLAHFDGELPTLEVKSGQIVCSGLTLTSHLVYMEASACIYELRPTASMILFAGIVLNVLPARAHVEWRKGWPIFRCPPNDDREAEADPSPLLPTELEPA